MPAAEYVNVINTYSIMLCAAFLITFILRSSSVVICINDSSPPNCRATAASVGDLLINMHHLLGRLREAEARTNLVTAASFDTEQVLTLEQCRSGTDADAMVDTSSTATAMSMSHGASASSAASGSS